MPALADTLTTREALRRAVLEDILTRCQDTAVVMEGGPLDGLAVVSIGKLRDQVAQALEVELPPASERHAEVSTPASVFAAAMCPECGLPVEITVNLSPRLIVTDDGATISVKAKSKARDHIHGQLSLSEADGQVAIDVTIDDLRLRILRAVYDVGAARLDKANPGPPPTLDVIAQRLEFAMESERGDLEDSLYHYAELPEPLVTILSVKGSPPEYVLTEAGETLVLGAEADAQTSGDDQDDATS